MFVFFSFAANVLSSEIFILCYFNFDHQAFTPKISRSAAFSWQPFSAHPLWSLFSQVRCTGQLSVKVSASFKCVMISEVCDDFWIPPYDHGVTMGSAVQGGASDYSQTGRCFLSWEINLHTRCSLSQGLLKKIMLCSLPDPKFSVPSTGCWRVTSPCCSLLPWDSNFCKPGTPT